MKLSPKNYTQWCEEVSHNNEVMTDCLKFKKDRFEELSDEIKSIFFDETGKSPVVSFSTMGDIIRIRIGINFDQTLPISSKFLENLIMPVGIGISYSDEMGTHLLFELKPDLGGDS